MLISYRGLEFEVERITQWSHRAVFDETGLDFLYNHVVIGVTCVFHPRATRSNKVTGQGTTGDDWGNAAPVSVRDLRAYMMQPQGRLKVTVGNVVVLESPLRHPFEDRNLACDANGGPKPLQFNVLNNYAGRSLVCYFQIETYVNDFFDLDKTPSILSHRWSQTHNIDELNYTTRLVRGTAIFRKDFLVDHPQDPTAWPDDFRSKLFHPIPDGMKREGIEVTQRPNGTQVDYSFRDVEQCSNLGIDNPVLKIQGRWRQGYVDSQMFGWAKRTVSVNVQVWGRRTSTRQELIFACNRVVANFGFGNVVGNNPLFYFHRDWDVDIINKHVSLTLGVFATGSASTILNVWLANVFGAPILNFPESLPNVTTINVIPNPRPPNAAGTRGTHLERMVSQVLTNPATVPTKPTDPTPTAVNKVLSGTGGY